jgi:hypothetical protein
MFVGVARLVLQIPGARSLKDRRQVVKSFKEVLSHARSLAASLGGAILADSAMEIVSFGSGGSGMRGGIEQALGRDADLDDELDDDVAGSWPPPDVVKPRERKGRA